MYYYKLIIYNEYGKEEYTLTVNYDGVIQDIIPIPRGDDANGYDWVGKSLDWLDTYLTKFDANFEFKTIEDPTV